jgi:hypothetical protein
MSEMGQDTEFYESWFEKYVEPWLDRCLRALEFAIVAALAAVVFLAAIYEIHWIIGGGPPSERQTRIQSVLTTLNQNWKIGLLLLIPLFYRTVRAFLQRAEEFAGIKAPREPVAVRQAKVPTSEDSPGTES